MFTLTDIENEKENPDTKTSPSSRFFFLIIAVGIILGAFIKLFVFDFLHVSGRSMMPSIQNGDTIFVNKLRFGIGKPFSENLMVQWDVPHKNDVVIYLYKDKIVVKRCVAIGGEKIRCEREDSDGSEKFFLLVNEKKINLNEIQYENMKYVNEVPKGYIFAVGDNYEESLDSRNYGFISTKNILGKVLWK